MGSKKGSVSFSLSEDGKKALAKAYLNPYDNTTLAKQMTKISKLSPTQRGLLFGDKASVAHDLSKISNLYGEAKVANFTPKTGFPVGKIKQGMTELMAGVGLGATGSMMHIPHAIPVSAALAAATPVYGQAMQHALRSNLLKDAYLKSISKGAKKSFTPTGRIKRTAAIAAMPRQKENQNGS